MIATTVVSVTLALLLGVSGCSRSDRSSDTVEPVASTIDISEPIVVVQDGSGSSPDGDLTVSEAVPGDAATEPVDEFVVSDDVITLPPEEVDELLGSESSPTPTSQPAQSAPNTETTATTGPDRTDPTTAAPTTTPTPTSTPPPSPEPTPSSNPVTTTSPPVGSTTTAPVDAIELDPLGPRPDESGDDPVTPLSVVQHSPQGEVQIAPYVTVTFNQAMKPYGSSLSSSVPITLEPETAGNWRWLGDRTVRFEPNDSPDGRIERLPAATLYRVTVSGEIESATEQKLGEALSWQFATPPPSVIDVVGASQDATAPPQVDNSPVFVIRSDQHIRAEDVIAATTLTANGSEIEIRPATNAEVAARPSAADAIATVGAERTAAFTTVEALPAAADLTLTIGPDLASLEGDLVQTEVVTYFATTRSAPQIESSACIPNDCSAGAALSITLNNALDTTDQSRTELAELITVEPAIPNLEINVLGNRITLVGDTAANTEYTVTLAAGLRDVFGQALAEPKQASFSILDAHPFFDGPRSEMVILDPEAARPTLAVQTINHDRLHIRVWAVTTRDYATYFELREEGDSEPSEVPEEWLQLFDDTIAVEGDPNELITTEIDLDDELSQAGSQLVVLITPDPAIASFDSYASQNEPLWTWVQRTALGVDAIADESTLMIWTTDLRTGDPVGGIPVALIGDSRVATTDEEGIQVVKLTDDPIDGLIANDGNTVTYLPAPTSDGWKISESTQQSRWQVILDGTSYRPGEQIRLTGWIRGLDLKSDRLLSTPDESTEVVYTVIDAANNEIAAGSMSTNQRGGFSTTIDLSADIALGNARIVLRSGNSSTIARFEISQFLAPEFEVGIQPNHAPPFLAENPIELVANARYATGNPVANAEATWAIETNSATYRPPNWQKFEFGADPSSTLTATKATTSPQPYCPDCPEVDAPKTIGGTTDGAGSHTVALNIETPEGFPIAVAATVDLSDADENTSSSEETFLVHPAQQYVGLRTERLFTELGQPIEVSAVVVDIDGTRRPGREVTLTLNQVVSNWKNGEWLHTLEEVDRCGLVSTASEDGMSCNLVAESGGEYLLRATVVDISGKRSVTEMTHWVSGSLALPSSPQQLEQVTVVPDRDHYEPGDTARLLIGAPWAPARGVVVLSRYNIEETIPFETEDGSAIVEVPISERSVPNVTGWVTMLGAAPRLDANGRAISGETRPAVASGRINLSVPAVGQQLNVAVRPATTTMRPGQDTTITVDVTDQQGEPVADSQVVLLIADETALAASDYSVQNPADLFYADYPGELRGISSRQYVQLLDTSLVNPNPEVAAIDEGSGPGSTDDGTGTDEQSDPTGRTDTTDRFAPIALYSTDNFTGDDGTTVIDFRAPDRASEYRITALVVGTDQQFGSSEAVVAAGQPLDVTAVAPEFIRVGDSLELPVKLQNHTEQPLQVSAAIEASGADLAGPAGQQVTVDPETTVEIRFPLEAAEVGSASIRLVTRSVAAADEESAASSVAEPGPDNALRTETTLEIPIIAPATAQTFVSDAVLNVETAESTVQSVSVPRSVDPGFGGLQISASTSAISALTGVANQLADAEQPSSNSGRAAQVIATAALRDRSPELFGWDNATTDSVVRQARQSFQRLLGAQRVDGAWSEWPRAADADPWVTVVAADAVLTGLEAGWGSISNDDQNAMLSYLADIDAQISSNTPDSARNMIRAYAVRVLRRAGGDWNDIARERADRLFDDAGGDLAPDAAALIWPSVTSDERRAWIEESIAARRSTSTTGVGFETGYTAEDHVIDWSQQRTDATVLAALVEMAPQSELIEPALEGLLTQRVMGTWGNDQANTFATLAIGAYVDRFEPPDGEAQTDELQIRALLDTDPLIDDRLSGPQAVRAELSVDELVGTNSQLTVTITGTGRLFLHSELTYAPSSNAPPSQVEPNADPGAVVERSYEPILDATDVIRQPDGSWLIKRGAPVRVRLVMVTSSAHTGVALRDFLPAGLTPERPSLAVAQSNLAGGASDRDTLASASEYAKWRGWNWFDHQTLTARSTEVVTNLLDSGSFEYIYVARASSAGSFVAPPATATATDDSGVSGMTPADTVVID